MVATMALWLWLMPPQTAREFFDTGSAQQRAGNLAAAEKSFRDSLRLAPENVAAMGNLAIVLSQQGKHAEAIELYRQALEKRPNSPPLLLSLGIAQYRIGDCVAAIGSLSQVPSNLQARELSALCLFETGEYARAASGFESLIKDQGEQPRLLYALGQVLLKMNREKEAERVLKRMFELSPGSPEIHLLLAQAAMNRQQWDEALRELDVSQKGNPDLPLLRFWRASVLEKLGRTDEAIQLYREEAAARPLDPLPHYGLGQLYEKLGDASAAVRELRLALAGDSQHIDASFYLARALHKLGNAAEALPHAVRSASRAGESGPHQYLLLQIYQKLGKAQEAKKAAAVVRKLKAVEQEEREKVFRK